jgi:D-serine deaminase-like pyridoxal phosphate-dependent protein
MDKQWYEIENTAHFASPGLVFYPDRILENVKKLKNSIDDVNRLRPHVKTHKSSELTLLMLQAGINKFKCATIAEAEMLGNCRAPDVLLAYQLVGPNIERFIKLQQTFPLTQFSCLIDNEQSLNELSTAALDAGVIVSVYLDLNVGMNRTGIIPGEIAVDLYKAMKAARDIRVIGLHIYDGHIHDASYEKRSAQFSIIWESIVAFKDQLLLNGFDKPVIIAGGTPTFPFYAEKEEIECSPGTFILWDKGYQDAFTEQNYLIAALIISRVISLPGDDLVSLDLGHKAVAAENELKKRISFLNAPEAQVLSQSEEHLVLKLHPDHGYNIGDLFYGLPQHICPTVALYDRAAVVYDHECKEEWKITARNRMITI